MDGWCRQLSEASARARVSKPIENLLDQSAPLARDGIDQRAQFGGVLKVPEQFVIGPAMAEIAQAPREFRRAPAEIAPQRRSTHRRHASGFPRERQQRTTRVEPSSNVTSSSVAVPRRKDPRDRQAGVRGSEVEQGLRLQVGHRAVFRGIGDLQDIFAALSERSRKF